ncbi:hypothetical protein [Leptospira stimsonii]|uniref:Uncharacterized protein n=1 Tax=Leptospira stimsonii TaxID=2202203 RepID=A0A8B3CS21_9LEPT|nr:hypothetical protein [Leptospira stimsonii]RHX86003.1 hypothetical protein DLM78_08950 [Leptospira stimsonii]
MIRTLTHPPKIRGGARDFHDCLVVFPTGSSGDFKNEKKKGWLQVTTDFLLQGDVSFSDFFWFLSLNAFHVGKLIRLQQYDRGGVVFKLR